MTVTAAAAAATQSVWTRKKEKKGEQVKRRKTSSSAMHPTRAALVSPKTDIDMHRKECKKSAVWQISVSKVKCKLYLLSV